MINTVSNWVLIKPDFTEKEIIGGLHVETSYNNERHAPTKGIVISPPDVLIDSFMEWKTSPDLKPGDTVFFHFLAVLNAIGSENRTLDIDDETCYFIRYSSIFAKMDSTTGAIQPLNGYLLMEPIKKETEVVFDNKVGSFHESIARVRYAGAINESYRYSGYKDNPIIKQGDIVLLDKACNTFVTNPIYYGNKEQSYFRAQRTNVLAILE